MGDPKKPGILKETEEKIQMFSKTPAFRKEEKRQEEMKARFAQDDMHLEKMRAKLSESKRLKVITDAEEKIRNLVEGTPEWLEEKKRLAEMQARLDEANIKKVKSESKTENAKLSVVVRPTKEKAPVSEIADKKNEAHANLLHKVDCAGTSYSYETRLENNVLKLASKSIPPIIPLLNEAIIIYITDQIMQSKKILGNSINIDLPENMDAQLKEAYLAVCRNNKVDCFVNGVKLETLQELKQKLENINKNIEEKKVPLEDCARQITAIKEAAKNIKDFKGSDRLISMADALENKLMKLEKNAKLVEPDVKVTASPTRKV